MFDTICHLQRTQKDEMFTRRRVCKNMIYYNLRNALVEKAFLSRCQKCKAAVSHANGIIRRPFFELQVVTAILRRNAVKSHEQSAELRQTKPIEKPVGRETRLAFSFFCQNSRRDESNCCYG